MKNKNFRLDITTDEIASVCRIEVSTARNWVREIKIAVGKNPKQRDFVIVYFIQLEPNTPPAGPQNGNNFTFVNNFTVLVVKLLITLTKCTFNFKKGTLFLLHRLILIYV